MICPYCHNEDRRLLEPSFLLAATRWFCLVCAKTWTEGKKIVEPA